MNSGQEASVLSMNDSFLNLPLQGLLFGLFNGGVQSQFKYCSMV